MSHRAIGGHEGPGLAPHVPVSVCCLPRSSDEGAASRRRPPIGTYVAAARGPFGRGALAWRLTEVCVLVVLSALCCRASAHPGPPLHSGNVDAIVWRVITRPRRGRPKPVCHRVGFVGPRLRPHACAFNCHRELGRGTDRCNLTAAQPLLPAAAAGGRRGAPARGLGAAFSRGVPPDKENVKKKTLGAGEW